MLFLGFDTETTGKADFRAPASAEHQPDLVQLAAVLYDENRFYSKFDVIVIPQKEIEPGAEKTHGISVDLAGRVGIPRRVALALFYNFLKVADQIVAHNLNFDTRVLMTAAARENVNTEPLLQKTQFCTMLNSTNICKLPGNIAGKFKWPSLQEAYTMLVNEAGFEDAHDAMADTNACIAIHLALLKMSRAAA